METLSNRMKKYEFINRNYLIKKIPVIIRLDGRSFHSFTRGCNKPFDKNIMNSMVNASLKLFEEIQGCKLSYIQSDEVSFLLTDFEDINTQGWFDYNISKLISISASLMSVYFNEEFCLTSNDRTTAVFDSRCFNIPREEVSNYFLFRAKDWERNSIQMYAQSLFSHKQLQNKKKNDIHEMLYSIGKNWTNDLTDQQKNGTFLIKTENGIEKRTNILPHFENINEIVKEFVRTRDE